MAKAIETIDNYYRCSKCDGIIDVMPIGNCKFCYHCGKPIKKIVHRSNMEQSDICKLAVKANSMNESTKMCLIR